jgi:glucosyl-3-phosphoglycerate synthase
VGDICRSVSENLVAHGFVDELVVVVDSRSTDGTAEAAAAAGASVFMSAELRPEVPVGAGGKGDVLWRSLAAASGDLIVWMDADLTLFDPSFVPKLVAPLLMDEEVMFVKGRYRRDLDPGSGPGGGGRVTELVARPLLNLFYPELAHIVQPLAGEMAGRREALASLPVVTGYGVEVALLIDMWRRFGPTGVAQVDLGERHHRSRDLQALGRAAHQIMQAVLARLESEGRIKLDDELPTSLVQFVNDADRLLVLETSNVVEERPPFGSIGGHLP